MATCGRVLILTLVTLDVLPPPNIVIIGMYNICPEDREDPSNVFLDIPRDNNWTAVTDRPISNILGYASGFTIPTESATE